MPQLRVGIISSLDHPESDSLSTVQVVAVGEPVPRSRWSSGSVVAMYPGEVRGHRMGGVAVVVAGRGVKAADLLVRLAEYPDPLLVLVAATQPAKAVREYLAARKGRLCVMREGLLARMVGINEHGTEPTFAVQAGKEHVDLQVPASGEAVPDLPQVQPAEGKATKVKRPKLEPPVRLPAPPDPEPAAPPAAASEPTDG